MIEDSIQDFRHVIEEKIKAKKHALDNTEQSLKKYAVLRDNANSAGVISSQPPRGPRGSIRGRLGPQVTQKPSIESRLGPKVQENEAVEDDTYEPTILSRVVVEQQKSRDEALAEETQKMNKKDKQVRLEIIQYFWILIKHAFTFAEEPEDIQQPFGNFAKVQARRNANETKRAEETRGREKNRRKDGERKGRSKEKQKRIVFREAQTTAGNPDASGNPRYFHEKITFCI